MAAQVFEEVKFLIPGYTPETMPLTRLLEYLEQIAAVMGEDLSKELHLVGVQKSSVKPVFKMLPETAFRVREHAAAVRTGYGTQKQRAGYRRIREMVRRDGGRPAKLVDKTGILLDFEPIASASEVVASVRQQSTFDGKLIRVGGQTEDSTVQIEPLAGSVQSSFTAARIVAKEMGKFLFEPIRVFGAGIWKRNGEGQWSLDNMRIQTFELLNSAEMPEILGALRSADVDWPDDADEKMLQERLS